MSTAEALKSRYNKYLAAVSSGRLDQNTLSEFVADQCEFNGNNFNPKHYGEYVASFRDRCEDGLKFELVDIVVDGDNGRLASKLSVTGKPREGEEFMGYQGNGRSVTFKEAAFYVFKDEKIVWVYTIVDRGDVADCLADKTGDKP